MKRKLSGFKILTVRISIRLTRKFGLDFAIESALSRYVIGDVKLTVSKRYILINSHAYPFHRQWATLVNLFAMRQRLRFNINLREDDFRMNWREKSIYESQSGERGIIVRVDENVHVQFNDEILPYDDNGNPILPNKYGALMHLKSGYTI